MYMVEARQTDSARRAAAWKQEQAARREMVRREAELQAERIWEEVKAAAALATAEAISLSNSLNASYITYAAFPFPWRAGTPFLPKFLCCTIVKSGSPLVTPLATLSAMAAGRMKRWTTWCSRTSQW
jgi:hypothetical protein